MIYSDAVFRYLLKRKKPGASRPQKPLTVGIPRAMTYYQHGRLWENFFTLLGCSIQLSPETNRRILDNGVALCSNETCLPVKVMAGHVYELAGKCDVIFIPRYKSTERNEKCCPKLCGLPDMMRLNLRGKADIMEVAIDVDKDDKNTDETLGAVAEKIGVSQKAAKEAFETAVRNKLNADAKSRLAKEMEIGSFSDKKTVAVLGHPYMIYDRFLSMNLIGKLKARGLNVITPDTFDHGTRSKNAYPYFGEKYFYAIGSDNLGCAYACAKRPEVAGIIYLTPFACGIDSLVTELISRHLKTVRDMPYMVLSVDEHTGEAGFDTRIEAFLDMLSNR